MSPQIRTAIASIDENAWTPIEYPTAVYDDEGRWVSLAQVAETEVTIFTSGRKSEHVICRLVVRRVKRSNPVTDTGQGELFATHRHHAFVTNSKRARLRRSVGKPGKPGKPATFACPGGAPPGNRLRVDSETNDGGSGLSGDHSRLCRAL